MPDAGTNGLVTKPNTSSQVLSADASAKNNSDRKINTFNSDFNQRPATTVDNKSKNNASSRVPGRTSKSNVGTEIAGPDVWVQKWVDYSSKYGLGYLLSNGSIGVFFNDSSKIILETGTSDFNYIERKLPDRQEVIYPNNLNSYSDELKKKVTLLQHFKSYLEGESPANPIKADADADKKNMVYVKKWMRTKHAIMFRLSNKIVQVCFLDRTEIILSSESRVVTYVNKKQERSTYDLSSALESTNYEMTKRLKYTKDILTHMLALNSNPKAKKDI
jgi:polo-like kinase 1